MIVEMKRFLLVCLAAGRKEVLSSLREAGCAHLDKTPASSEEFRTAEARLSGAARAIRILQDAAAGKPPFAGSGETELDDETAKARTPDLTRLRGADFAAAVLQAEATRSELARGIARLEARIATYEPFGSFSPAAAAELEKKGFKTVLAAAPLSADASAVKADVAQELSRDARFAYYALVNPQLPLPAGFETVRMPPEPLDAMKSRLEIARSSLEDATASLAAEAGRKDEIAALEPGLRDAADFAAAEESLGRRESLAWISGWVPYDAVPALRERAAEGAWGLLVRDARPGENPPTLVRPPKAFRAVAALFSALGIAPAYSESDVSVPFFAYFTIFFAMLVGDAGYGALALLLTLAAKMRLGAKFPRPWLVLLCVFCTATVAWGALTNTWFGAQISGLSGPVARWLDSGPGGQDAEFKHIMLLCFSLGASHLILARLWNAVCVFPDRTFLAQCGWAGIVFFMYWLTCSIVGIFSGVPRPVLWLMCASVACVFLFTLRKSELKTRGIELGMLPLNIMSALGDVISYVRLFAVGLASVKVAQNFNSMALDLDIPPWAKILPAALILLIGHGLNFMMAGLSILVHAVRLNTLEFSNHKGITWSGYAYGPFRKH